MPTERQLRANVKEALRRQMRALRSDTPDSAKRRRSADICQRVQELRSFTNARNIAAYVPVHGEVDVYSMIRKCLSKGKGVLLPRVDADNNVLVLHEWHGQKLSVGEYGIPSPSVDDPIASPQDVDFVLIPALATDERGFRVGYGKGYYDRLLPTLTNALGCTVVYDFQLVAEVPTLDHDVASDMIVTDMRTVFSSG